MRSRFSRRAFLALALLAILTATMWPLQSRKTATVLSCIVCGDHGAADVLLNVLLFVPFGAALALERRSIWRCALFGALLSAVVEFAQLYIPGRDSSIGDVLSNGSGATLGAILARTAPVWLLPSPKLATRLSRCAAFSATALCFLTGVLLAPAFPDALYYGMWTPDLGHLERYRGRVQDATINALHVTDGPMADSRLVRELLDSTGGFSLQVHALAGPRLPALGPLFAIFDGRQREIILLGPDRDDLVFRFRTRAAAVRLDQPDIRLENAMRHITTGDVIDLSVRREGKGRGFRITVNGWSDSRRGFSVGSGWALLLYPEVLPRWLRTLLSAVWVGGLSLPAGFWMRTRGDALFAGALLLAGLIGAPALTPLLPTPAYQWAAAALGVLAGTGFNAVLCCHSAEDSTRSVLTTKL